MQTAATVVATCISNLLIFLSKPAQRFNLYLCLKVF